MACENCNCETPTLGIYGAKELPKYHSLGAACFDLEYHPNSTNLVKYFDEITGYERVEYSQYSLPIEPNRIYMLPTGLRFDIPNGYSVRIYPRSSTPIKYGLSLSNNTGIIDSDYVDEIFLMMRSHRKCDLQVGTRLCQAELVKVLQADFRLLQEAPGIKGNRSGGFGSTGL